MSLLLVILLVCQPSRAQQKVAVDRKFTNVNLTRYGWQPSPTVHAPEVDSLTSERIAVDDQGRVLVGFTMREPHNGRDTRLQPGLSFRIVRFGVNGEADLSLDLPTNNWLGNGVYLDEVGRIIARADDKLQMLTAPAEGLVEPSDWRTLAACTATCRVNQSPSRRTLYLHTWDANPPVSILDAANPSIATHCTVLPYGTYFVADDFAYSNQLGGSPPGTAEVIYHSPLCDSAQRSEVPITSRSLPHPLNDSLMLVKAARELLVVRSLDGRTVVHAKLSTREGAEVVWGDDTGDRFAAAVTVWRGGSWLLDIGSHRTARRVAVYETATGRELITFPVTPRALIDVAMSPDGHRIAVLANEILTIADVP